MGGANFWEGRLAEHLASLTYAPRILSVGKLDNVYGSLTLESQYVRLGEPGTGRRVHSMTVRHRVGEYWTLKSVKVQLDRLGASATFRSSWDTMHRLSGSMSKHSFVHWVLTRGADALSWRARGASGS